MLGRHINRLEDMFRSFLLIGKNNMVKLPITLTNRPGMNCRDGLLLSIAEWMNLPSWDLAFLESWTLDFSENAGNTIGKALGVRDNLSENILRDYYGCIIQHRFTSDMNRSKSLLQRRLRKGLPTIIKLDQFWCPWTKTFQKIHGEDHHSLLVGYTRDGFICMDYAPRCDYGLLPYDFFTRAVSNIITVSVTEPKINTDPGYDFWLDKAISATYASNTIENIRRFSRFILDSFNPQQEREIYNDFTQNPITWQIARISESRILFARSLRYLANEYSILALLNIAELLETTRPMWSVIISLIIKSCIGTADTDTLDRLVQRINEVAIIEEQCYQHLIDVKQNPFISWIQPRTKENCHSWVYVQLDEYMNNRATVSLNNDIVPDMTGEGAFILWDRNDYLECGDIIYRIAYTNKYDNIRCEGQHIIVPSGYYSKIAILCCASMDNYSDKITLKNADRTNGYITMDVSDCYPPKARYENTIAWMGYCSHNRETLDNEFQCQLYSQFYDLNSDDSITSIMLPFCPGIHIFAISLLPFLEV